MFVHFFTKKNTGQEIHRADTIIYVVADQKYMI